MNQLVTKMKCPSCGAPQAGAGDACEACGLTLKSLDERFGFVPRHVATVTDLGQILSVGEIARIEKKITAFTRRFPGTAFAVILTKLPAVREPSEYCFWLINRGNFAQSDAKLGRNRTILLLLDSTGPSASLMVGYGLEHVFAEADLQNAAEETKPFLEGQDFLGAALAGVDAVSVILKQNIDSLAAGKAVIQPAGESGSVKGLEPASRVSS